jgi:hypothetical protein
LRLGTEARGQPPPCLGREALRGSRDPVLGFISGTGLRQIARPPEDNRKGTSRNGFADRFPRPCRGCGSGFPRQCLSTRHPVSYGCRLGRRRSMKVYGTAGSQVCGRADSAPSPRDFAHGNRHLKGLPRIPGPGSCRPPIAPLRGRSATAVNGPRHRKGITRGRASAHGILELRAKLAGWGGREARRGPHRRPVCR